MKASISPGFFKRELTVFRITKTSVFYTENSRTLFMAELVGQGTVTFCFLINRIVMQSQFKLTVPGSLKHGVNRTNQSRLIF